MMGVLQLASLTGLWPVTGAVLDYRFDRDRYFRNGSFITRGAVEADFSRASAAIAENLDGTYTEFTTNEPRILPGLGLLVQKAATGLIDPFDMSVATLVGSTKTVLTETFFGIVNNAIRIASGGSDWHRCQIQLGGFVTGDTLAVQSRYRAGTSGQARIVLRSTNENVLSGPVGNLNVATNNWGVITDIQNIDLGDGLYEVRFKVTLDDDRSNMNVAFGPNSTVAGEYVDWITCDVKNDTSFTSPSDGARAADAMNVNITNQTSYTFATDFIYNSHEGYAWPIALNDGSLDNEFGVFIALDGSTMYVKCRREGSQLVQPSITSFPGALSDGDRVTLAVNLDGGTIHSVVALNGVINHERTDVTYSGALPTVDSLNIGYSANNVRVNSTVRRVVLGEDLNPSNLVQELIAA